jgi:predicted MFS family arabinose efflux permease
VPTTDNQELNYWLFIGTRVVTGLTGGLMGGLVLAIIGDVIPLERRGRAMAVVTIAFSLAAILGVPLALTLVDLTHDNWHVPFYFVSGLSLPIWLLCFRFIPSMTSHFQHRQGEYKRTETMKVILKTREQRNALLFTVLLVLGQFTTISFLTPYMINNVHIQQHDIKYIYLTGGACTVVTGFIIGRMVDKLGRFRVFTIFALLSIIPIWITTHLPEVPLWVVLSISGMFFIFVSGRMIPANTISSAVVSPQHRAGFMSLNSACMSLSVGLSAIIAGSIISQDHEHAPLVGYNYVGYVAIAATILSLALVRLLRNISSQNATAAK